MPNDLRSRRALLKATLRALDTSIARHPGDASLKFRREAIARELASHVAPGDLPLMHARLAELEETMSRLVVGVTKMQELVREHQQLTADLAEAERWGQDRG